MGIDIMDTLVVGAPYEELELFFISRMMETSKSVDDVADMYFTRVVPYSYAVTEQCFFGFRVPNYQEVNEYWLEVVRETAYQFKLLTGVDAVVRGGAHVYCIPT